MYFIIGGRKVQSGLYRVTYVGGESTAPAELTASNAADRKLRRELEALHRPGQSDVVEEVWPYLNHPDRFIRYAARTALEQCPADTWQARALAETDDQSSLTALLALVRLVPPVLDASTKKSRLTAIPPACQARRDRMVVSFAGAASRTFANLWPGTPSPRPHGQSNATATHRAVRRHVSDARSHDGWHARRAALLSPIADRGHEGRQLSDVGDARRATWRCARYAALDAGWTPSCAGDSSSGSCRASRTAAAGLTPVSREKSSTTRRLDFRMKKRVVGRSAQCSAKEASQPGGDDSAPVRQRLEDGRIGADDLREVAAPRLRAGQKALRLGAVLQLPPICQRRRRDGPDLTSLAGRFSARDILESVLEPDKVISDQYAAIVVQTTAAN